MVSVSEGPREFAILRIGGHRTEPNPSESVCVTNAHVDVFFSGQKRESSSMKARAQTNIS